MEEADIVIEKDFLHPSLRWFVSMKSLLDLLQGNPRCDCPGASGEGIDHGGFSKSFNFDILASTIGDKIVRKSIVT